MEKNFFDYESWDGDFGEFMVCFNCTLKVDVGEYKAGDKIPSINWVTTENNFTMEFIDAEGNVLARFPLKVVLA